MCVCVCVVTSLSPPPPQEVELTAEHGKEMEARLLSQEWVHQRALAAALARLRGIESTVDTVTNAGIHTHAHAHARTRMHTHTRTHTRIHIPGNN